MPPPRPPLPQLPSSSLPARLGGMVDGYLPARSAVTQPRATARIRPGDPFWVWAVLIAIMFVMVAFLVYDYSHTWTRVSRGAPLTSSEIPPPAIALPPALPPPAERPSPFLEDESPATPEPAEQGASRARQSAGARTREFRPESRPLTFELPKPTQASGRSAVAIPPPPSIASAAARPAIALPPARQPHVAVVTGYETARQSRLLHVVGKFPGLRRFQQYADSGSGFEPAHPLNDIRFVFPQGGNPELAKKKQMDVKATIEPTGHVSKIELLSLPDEDLVNMLSYAAGEWRFQAAQLNGKPVATEMILHFALK